MYNVYGPGVRAPLRGMDIPIYAYIWIYLYVSLGPDLETSWSDFIFGNLNPPFETYRFLMSHF